MASSSVPNFKLVRRLHRHLVALRLKDLFSVSPLVMLYQPLGTTSSYLMGNTVRKLAADATGGSAATGNVGPFEPRCIQVDRKTALALNDPDFSPFFQGSSTLLLGWQLPAHSRRFDVRVRYDDDVSDLCKGFLSSFLRDAAVPAQELKTCIDLSVKAAQARPAVLLACFYRGRRVKVRHLPEWLSLDAGTVYSQLLAQIEGASEALLDNLDGTGRGLVEGVESAAGLHDVLAFLDHRASAPPPGPPLTEAAAGDAPGQQQAAAAGDAVAQAAQQ